MEFRNDLQFIIGYLSQNIRYGGVPEKINEILVFLCKEIQDLKDQKEKK